ncbi:MAG: DegT/DnrJ/EryC1/StrS family aminotransferase [Thermoleophilaceae bacterium]|nr:DegT/DnrJ/EryC1/StrS family aminotransferase [Thermoleophilaceae bacterium]
MTSIPLFDTASNLTGLRPQLDAAIKRVLDSGRYILGPEVAAFENEFADYVGTEFAIGVGNGTDALSIALLAAGVEAGDDVVVPSFTFYASAEAALTIGANVVYCDIDPATMNVTPETVAAALTPNTRAVVAVHLFGLPAPVDQLRSLADEHDFKIVEDAAQAVGAKLHGARAGSLGDVATFSFFPSKNLGAFGDAGMITTSDPQIEETARLLRHHGTTNKQMHTLVGFNSRLDAIQAALLRVLLPYIDTWNAGRRAAADAYASAGVAEIVAPQLAPEGATSVHHLYVVQDDDPDGLASALTEHGVEARGYYRTPIHRQPATEQEVDLPATDRAAARNIALPMSPTLREEQVQVVVEALASVRG